VNDELVAAAELGDEAKRFLESDLGRCILGMAEQEVHLAQEALAEVDPTDIEAIRKLQNHAKLYRQFNDWLKELLDKGEAALQAFIQQRSVNE
jgi:hypothetical protein